MKPETKDTIETALCILSMFTLAVLAMAVL